jgi:hypothetical protein
MCYMCFTHHAWYFPVLGQMDGREWTDPAGARLARRGAALQANRLSRPYILPVMVMNVI